MKININTKEKKLNLWIPTSLLTSRFVIKAIIKQVCDEDLPINREQLYILVDALCKYCKNNKGFVLVDVVTKDHETVKITL